MKKAIIKTIKSNLNYIIIEYNYFFLYSFIPVISLIGFIFINLKNFIYVYKVHFI